MPQNIYPRIMLRANRADTVNAAQVITANRNAAGDLS